VWRDFLHPFRPALGTTQPPVQWCEVSFAEVKRPGHGGDQAPISSAGVKDRRNASTPQLSFHGLIQGEHVLPIHVAGRDVLFSAYAFTNKHLEFII